MKSKKDKCRKQNDCLSCVQAGCMFPGYRRFPCRESWDDMEGDFPYNPPPVTESDCLALQDRNLITSNRPSMPTTSAPTQNCPTHTSTAVVVFATLAVVGVLWGLWNVVKIIWDHFHHRMNFARVEYRDCVEEPIELD